MKQHMDDIIEEMSVAGRLLLFATILPITIFNAYIASVIWMWFFVPFGLPDIGVAVMLGVMGFVSFLTHNPSMATKKVESAAHWVIERAFYSLLVLFNAWIVHQFV